MGEQNIQQIIPKDISQSTDLSAQEVQKFTTEAIGARDEFVNWSQKELHRDEMMSPRKGLAGYIKSFQESPSKNLLLASLSAVGLSNIGLTIAGNKIGLSNSDIAFHWYGTFGAPILEELLFRSRKIPKFISLIGEKVGFPVRSDRARLGTSALFALAHVDQMLVNRLAPLQVFAASETFQKISHERGLAASIACHSLFNAVNLGAMYSFDGPLLSRLLGQKSQGFLRSAIKDDRQYNFIRTLTNISLIGLQIGIGIAGIKEILDDKMTNDLLDRVRGAKDGNILVDFNKIRDVSKSLLSNPSTDGYKFQAGIELMYTTAMLEKSTLPPHMTRESYAREQVQQAIAETWRNKKTLKDRVQKAFSYIDMQSGGIQADVVR
ncbi:MAG: CPBP family glutamic-type intramembrane protease [Patescibacteria group bacterium]